MLFLKRLSAVTQHELQACGYRASDLALLSQAGVPVASSFVVLSTAFDEMLRVNGLKYKIDYILSHAQEHVQSSLVNAYNGARKAILEAKLPPGLEVELREMYESITVPLAIGELVASNDRVPVRVIMSTNRLDDPENNDTVIQNVNDFSELLLAVREAWALTYHPSELRSRMLERFPESRMKVALIVQTMDRSTWTAHSYSCLPQDHHKVYLQVYGGYLDLREKIEKEYYAVGKESLRVVATQTGRQRQQLLRSEAKELIAVPISDRQEVLEREVLEIARLSKKCERLLQMPVKAFFTIHDEMHDLLWVNRLGFDVMIKPEQSAEGSAASVPHWPHQVVPAPVIAQPILSPSASHSSTASAEPASPAEPVSAVLLEPELALATPEPAPAQAPAAEPVVIPAPEGAPAAVLETPAGDFLEIVETPAPVQASLDAAAQAASPAVDVRRGVTAKLLGASLRIVRQVVERKYRGAFGETATVENIAEMVNRLNSASVFSRAVDGALLLKAEEAAKREGTLSELEYAKTIEEVAYLLSYA